MKKKMRPTASQYSYMVTGLLSAKVQRSGTITQEDIKMAVETAKTAYDLIADVIGELIEDNEEKSSQHRKTSEPMPNYFESFQWMEGKPTTWTELESWLKQQGITSNRQISKIFRESIDKGYIRRDEITRKYFPPLP